MFKKFLKVVAGLMLLVFALSLVVGNFAAIAGSSSNKTQSKQYTITLITMDSMDEHWLTVKAGAETAAKELKNVKVVFRAPAQKTDPNEQTRMVEDAITQKVSAILLAPTDKDALVPAVEKAYNNKIPVIIIDSPVATNKIAAFVATNNYLAGQMAADKLAELIGKKGKVAIINAQPGAGSVRDREQGFKDRIKAKYPNIKIVTVQYCNGDKALALSQTMDILSAHPDLAGFYACNEGSTVGVARGIKEKGVKDKVKVVGFDRSQDVINALKDGYIQAVVVQNPFKMGYLGVKMAIDKINGKKIQTKVDTGVAIVTKDNMNKPEIQKLLYPLGKK